MLYLSKRLLGVSAIALTCFVAGCSSDDIAPSSSQQAATATHTVTETTTKTTTATPSSASSASQPAPTVLTEGDTAGNGNVVRCDAHSAIGTESTSCPFAREVKRQYNAAPGAIVQATSPVTKESYIMRCEPGFRVTLLDDDTQSADAVRCTGGNNAVVIIF